MSNSQKGQPLGFVATVAAVLTGQMIWESFKNYSKHMSEGEISLISVVVFILLVGYAIISTIIDQIKNWIWARNQRKTEQEYVKSKGYETWAEYMEDHGYGDDVKNSWKLKADEERRRRGGI
jgi:hypothetical protein